MAESLPSQSSGQKLLNCSADRNMGDGTIVTQASVSSSWPGRDTTDGGGLAGTWPARWELPASG